MYKIDYKFRLFVKLQCLFKNLYKELKKYDGKGKCEQVDFLEMNYMELQNRRDIELWVKDCKWQVLADKENFLLVKRKES